MHISPIKTFNYNSYAFKASGNTGRFGRVAPSSENHQDAAEILMPVFTNPYLSDYPNVSVSKNPYMEDYPNVSVSSDVIRAKYLNLFRIAYKDPRSRASNRTALDMEFPLILKKLAKENKPLTVAMFDMDNFKSINEILGYTVGDEFISTIGNTIHDAVNPKGFTAYRYGGEEYMILFPGKTADEVQDIVMQVQDKISNNSMMRHFLIRYIRQGTEKINQLTEKQRPLQYLKALAASIVQARAELAVCNGNLTVDEGIDMVINAADTLLIKSDKKMVSHTAFKSLSLQSYIKGLRKRFESIQGDGSNSNAKTGEDLDTKLKILEEVYKNTLYGFIKDIAQTADPKEKEFLSTCIKKLDDCKSLTEFEKCDTAPLGNYIIANHDKSSQIATLKSWIAQVNRRQGKKISGFTITAGLKQFKPDTTKDVREYYEEVSDILKIGKSKNKGSAYFCDESRQDSPKVSDLRVRLSRPSK